MSPWPGATPARAPYPTWYEDDVDGNEQEDDKSASVCSDLTCQSSDHDTDITR